MSHLMIVKGTKYQKPCALVIEQGELKGELQFAQVMVYIDEVLSSLRSFHL